MCTMDVLSRALRVSLLLASFVPFIQCANLTYTEVSSSVLGHSRSPDGKLTWGGLPQETYNGLHRNAPSTPWQLTVDFTRAIINTIQKQNFPYDLVRRMINGQFGKKEIEAYVVNIAIACFTAALLILFLIICIVVYVRHEYRKREKQKYFVKRPTLSSKASRCLLVAMTLGTTINVIFIVLVSVVSLYTFNGFTDLNDRVSKAMTDVSKYFNTTKYQYSFVTSKTNDWLNKEVLGTDLDRIGYLVWEPGRDSFHSTVASVFTSLSDLDARTQNVLTLLKSVDMKVADIRAGLGTLMKVNISDLHFALSATVSDWTCIGCDGACPGCQPIVVDDIFYQTDFDKIPNISANIAQVSTLVATPTSGSMQSPEYYYYNGIPDILKSKYTSEVADLNKTLNNYQRIVRDSISALFFPTESDLFFTTLRGQLSDFHKMLLSGDKTRFGFTWIFVMLNSAGVILIVGSLMIALKEKKKTKKDIEPEYHFARVFLAGVVVGYIVLILGFMSIAIVLFYGGANLEKAACQPGKDLSFVEQVIDYPSAVRGHPGNFLASLILRNGSYDLKVADTYRSCQSNDYAYQVLKQNNTAPNLYSDLNYTAPFINTSAIFDRLYTSLPSVILVPSEYETWISQFQLATTLNRTIFDLMLNRSVVRAQLSSYIANLYFIANTSEANGGPLEPAKSRLLSIASDLKSIQPSINKLTVLKDDVWVDFSALKKEVDYINNITTLAVSKLRSVESILQGNSAGYITEGVDRYRAGFLLFLKEFTKQSQSWIPDIGLCQPLSDAYDEVIYSFCDNMADFENALWMLVGNNVVVLLVMTVLTIVTVYHLPDGLTEEDYNIDTEFESVFGNGNPPDGFLKKAIYKVKRVFEPPSTRRKSTKTSTSLESDNITNNGNTSIMADPDALELKMLQNGDSIHSGSRRESKATTDNQSQSSSSSKVITVKPQITRDASAGSIKESKSNGKMSSNTHGTSQGTSQVTSQPTRPVSSVSRQSSSGKIGTIVVSEVHPQPATADWADI